MAPKDGTNRDVEVRTEAMGRRRMGSEDEKSLAAEFMVNFFLENSKGGGVSGPNEKDGGELYRITLYDTAMGRRNAGLSSGFGMGPGREQGLGGRWAPAGEKAAAMAAARRAARTELSFVG